MLAYCLKGCFCIFTRNNLKSRCVSGTLSGIPIDVTLGMGEFLPSIGCVTLGKSLNLSVSQLPHLKNRDNSIYLGRFVKRIVKSGLTERIKLVHNGKWWSELVFAVLLSLLLLVGIHPSWPAAECFSSYPPKVPSSLTEPSSSCGRDTRSPPVWVVGGGGGGRAWADL